MDKEDTIHIDNAIPVSHRKKKERIPFAKLWMDLDFIILSEVSQKEKDKYHVSLIRGM